MEEEDDSEEKQDCEHRKKNEESSFSNDNNCVSQAFSDFDRDVDDRNVQDGDINSEHAGDIIKHADDDKDYIIVDHNRYEFEIKI